jgi:hypothetical protein
MLASVLSYPAWLENLNHYSNLLLVVLSAVSVGITIVYVVLTRKNLKEFQRSIRQERAAKHLDDIKEHVASPILDWVNLVQQTLGGTGSYNLLRLEQPDSRIRQPFESHPAHFPMNGFHAQIYSDAIQKHFPNELAQYDSFRNALNSLLDDVVEFARTSCESLWKTTKLSPPNVFDRTVPFVSFEEIVQAWLRFAVCGLKPDYSFQSASANRKGLFIQGNINALASDIEESIAVWLPDVFKRLDERWKFEKFGSRVARTLTDAESLRVAMLDIQFAQNLRGECKYLGY